MKAYPKTVTEDNVLEVVQEILSLRREDIREHNVLRDTKLQGRERTGIRTVPTAFDDVVADDLVGDVVNDGTYLYLLINDDGTKKWNRLNMNVSW